MELPATLGRRNSSSSDMAGSAGPAVTSPDGGRAGMAKRPDTASLFSINPDSKKGTYNPYPFLPSLPFTQPLYHAHALRRAVMCTQY